MTDAKTWEARANAVADLYRRKCWESASGWALAGVALLAFGDLGPVPLSCSLLGGYALGLGMGQFILIWKYPFLP